MKTTLTRVLLLTLAALMLMTAVACGKDPDKDPGYILNQSNTEAPQNEITAFYHGNEGTLDTLASDLTKKGKYMAYSYTYRMTDYENGTLEFYVQQQTKANGVWEACTDENANRLTNVKFIGTMTYNPTISKNIVVFIPRMAVTDKTLSLVYCTTDGDKDIVERGAYHKGCTVTLTKIEGNWYCAEAVKNSQ
jgi:hypothetical protein